jgi:soluble lytic murein transglycosylase-like protein
VNSFRVRALLTLVVLTLAALAHVLLSAPQGLQAATTNPSKSTRAASRILLPTRYGEAAQALRSHNLQEARQHLEQIAEQWPAEAPHSQVVAGLYAFQSGDFELAEQLLAAASTPGGPIEDWRLFALAESAKENDHAEPAAEALDKLLASCPESSLRPQAYLEAARLAHESGDERRTLTLIDGARHEGISGGVSIDLDNLAWEIGRETRDDGVRREAGRRLLAEAPLQAGALRVADTFRAMDGGDLDWSRILSSGEVKRRARSFLSLDRLTAALDTLDNVPERDRDVEWHLLRARALTESGKESDALALLDGVTAETREQRAEVEWQRAMATDALAASRGGEERKSLLTTSHQHLANVIRLGGDAQLTAGDLRRLYQNFLAAGLIDPAVDTLRALRRVDPGDSTGARKLWELGWDAYSRGEYAGAANYWEDLASVYPEHGDAQRGRYWRARALEKLGRADQARAIYRDLVASSDTSDFYNRRAIARLGDQPVSAAIEVTQLARAAAPWPADPLLQRPKLLTDLGLDDLARREMEIVEPEANPRDLLALRALVLGREGKRRESIALLREAFPALGGPQQSTVPEEILRAYYPLDYADAIRAQAAAHHLPAWLVAGIIRQESAFDPRATSPVGARGLMQLMPQTATETARRMNLRSPSEGLYNPDYSIELGTAYFEQLLKGFGGNVELALAGYNGGPNRIRRLWEESGPEPELDSFVENLDLDESRDYVKRILVLADSYRQLYPSIG